MPLKLITLATDGLTNHIVLPNGHRQNLGIVSPMKVVMALLPKREAHRLLEEFNKEGQTMFRADLEALEDLLAPKRVRWGALEDPLISRAEIDSHQRRGNKMAQDSEAKGAIAQQIARIEAQINQIAKNASAAGVARLRDLVNGLASASTDPGTFARAAAEQEPAEDQEGEEQEKQASVTLLNRNTSLVEQTLERVAATGQKIDQLEAAGKRFNSMRARYDLSRIATSLRDLVASTDLAQPYTTREVQKIASQAEHLAGLFSV